MTEETQAYTINKDGSISIKGEDGKTVRYVLESDLGAVKVQLKDKESEITKLQTDLAGATAKYDTAHQDVLKERAAKEQLEAGAKEATTYKEKVAELETKLAGLETTSGEMANKLTERLKLQLKTLYKVPDEKLADKALSDLETIESTLQLTGIVPGTANYDGGVGHGGGGNFDGKSPLSLAAIGYEETNKK